MRFGYIPIRNPRLGLGQASAETGAEILAETKRIGSQLITFVLIVGFLLFIKSKTLAFL